MDNRTWFKQAGYGMMAHWGKPCNYELYIFCKSQRQDSFLKQRYNKHTYHGTADRGKTAYH